MTDENVYDIIISDLTDCIYTDHGPDTILDPFDNKFTSTDLWFDRHGVRVSEYSSEYYEAMGLEMVDLTQEPDQDDVLTLPTFSMTDENFTLDGEECISPEEEEELCIGARILIDLTNMDDSDDE